MNNLDDQIKKALENGTKITQADRQDVWNHIEKELFTEKTKGELKVMKPKKKNRHTAFIAAAAAAVLLFIGAQTEMGHAVIDQIKELFAPQKQITQEIEGNKEKTNVNLQQPSKSQYVIYIDEERYAFIEGKDKDRIVMKTPVEGNFPEVSMEIEQVADRAPEDIIKDLDAQIRDKFEKVYAPQQVNEPINGWVVRGIDGQNWDSAIIKVYVVSNGSQGSFIITQHYFLEAAEGHGVRFDEMVKEFHIVNVSQ
ncbi:hypothetical protein [Geosporobacter ferrireducens]|uniref:DUF4367 domain-containing protein n=1 Tax=Geosporobacter ferrireducens TaxID=1424294 RepID=A0A1D8GDE6_9FIRM|nr:hypothetical protein [Geosporobacter ferrireducens]AOT68921.1 hypothetical protein Gferi_04740 [Geosporobacter ferrireducens]